MRLGARYSKCGAVGVSTQSGSVCDKRTVTSIVETNDNVIITYDDCSYTTAPRSVLQTKSSSDEKVTQLETHVGKLTELLNTVQTALSNTLTREDFEEKQIKNLAGEVTLTIHTLKE